MRGYSTLQISRTIASLSDAVDGWMKKQTGKSHTQEKDLMVWTTLKEIQWQAFPSYQKRYFSSASTNLKLTGISVRNAQLMISKKINSSFIANFGLGKYIFSIGTQRNIM